MVVLGPREMPLGISARLPRVFGKAEFGRFGIRKRRRGGGGGACGGRAVPHAA